MCVCVCVCVCVWTHWDAGLSGKLMAPLGTQSISVLWLWLKSFALLTPLILLLSVDMDQETVSHPSIAFCLTVCNINKKIHAHLHLGLTHCSHPYPHPALSLYISYYAWGVVDLGLNQYPSLFLFVLFVDAWCLKYIKISHRCEPPDNHSMKVIW